MKSLIQNKVIVIALVGVLVAAWAAPADAVTANSKTNALRSAFLGPDVWDDNLSSTEVKRQLQEHFAEVIERLESTNASSLLKALSRAEATTLQPWTKAQRRAALIYLAGNRHRQIARLRYYMNRGRFPQNEGQSKKAVPIFVDQHQTHCAVGYLMHADGKDSDVASVVNANNLVYVSDVQGGSMIQWILSSGLTQEEAALIQPAYPINLDATFGELSSPMATVQENGLVLSEATFRASRFNATLPSSFQSDPNAIQTILAQGQAAIEANNLANESNGFGSSPQWTNGVLFGSPGDVAGDFGISFPGNVDRSLYLGNDTSFGFLSGVFDLPIKGSASATATIFNAGIVEIEYLLRSEENDFSQIALSRGRSQINGIGIFDVEQSALFLLSEIYDGNTDVLLGDAHLFSSDSSLSGSDVVQLSTDFVRIKTFGLVVNGEDFVEPETRGALGAFFHEFEIAAVPEPGTGSLLILFGTATIARRRRTVLNKRN